MLSFVVFVWSVIEFSISEKFVLSSFIICVCGAKILSGREGIKHGLVPIPLSNPYLLGGNPKNHLGGVLNIHLAAPLS